MYCKLNKINMIKTIGLSVETVWGGVLDAFPRVRLVLKSEFPSGRSGLNGKCNQGRRIGIDSSQEFWLENSFPLEMVLFLEHVHFCWRSKLIPRLGWSRK